MTSTAARAPRAPKLFTCESADSIVPNTVADAIGLRHHRTQAPYYVLAPTKAAAVARLEELRFHPRARSLHLAGGNDLMAALDAGLIADVGDVLSWSDGYSGETVRNVVKFPAASTDMQVVGQWASFTVMRGGYRNTTRAIVRTSDGLRFPARHGNEDPTPATGWTAEILNTL